MQFPIDMSLIVNGLCACLFLELTQVQLKNLGRLEHHAELVNKSCIFALKKNLLHDATKAPESFA